MASEFPVLIGRVSLNDEWSLHLPFAVRQRFEERQMVLWRPGFTIFLSAWNNDKNESTAARKDIFAARTSPEKYDEVTTEDGGRLYYSYRLAEQADDERVAAFYGFAFSGAGHLQLSIYFDREEDAQVAKSVLHSANGSPATLSDPRILSQLCFATNMVMKDGQPVGYMYREAPDSANDSGWRFFAGRESQEYVDDPSNTKVYPVALVAEADHAVIPYLQAEPGAQFGRDGNGFSAE